MLNKLKSYENNNLQYIATILIFALCLIFSHIQNITDYPHDASYYWTIADSVMSSGTFNILDYPETFRGYFFPLLVFLFKTLFHGVWGWRVLIAAMVSITFGLLLPQIEGHRVCNVDKLLRSFIVALVFLYVWGNFIQFPLSDFPAIFFLLCSVVLLKQIINYELGISQLFALGVAAGAFLYASYSTRAVFLYAAAIVIFVFILKVRNRFSKLLVGIIALTIGVSIVALPQCLINHKYLGEYSPKVFTEQWSGYSHSLQAQQIYWGLTFPRYETFIGNPKIYPSPTVFFEDIIGVEILKREGLNIGRFSLGTFALLFVKYPLDMVGLYTRHLISVLTPAFNEVYIINIHNDKTLLILLSLSIWTIAFINFFSKYGDKNTKITDYGFKLAIVTPALLQLVGSAELRFFLPVYILIYQHVFFETNVKDLFKYIKKRWLQTLLLTTIIYLLWISLFGMIIADNKEKTLLINDNPIVSKEIVK